MGSCSKPSVCSGQLRHRVEIYQEDKADNQYGGQDITWSLFGTKSMKIEQMSAQETFRHMRIESQAMCRFTFRYFPGLEETMKFTYRGVDYNIRGIDNWELRDRWYIVFAERGVVQ